MGVGEQGAIATPVGVKRAIAYMRAHLAERIVLADLARAGGVSERALTRQFRTFLGKSPMNYLQQLRLAACRDRLLRPATGNSVTAAATEMGFTHFGRFADCYRRAFGETPSVTARRAAAAEQDAAPAVPHRHTPELVVLPLRSGTGEEARWAEHMLECLLARLSPTRIAIIRSAPREPRMTQAVPRDVPGRYCLSGRVMCVGLRLRVILALRDLAADRHLWGDCFDGTPTALFELEDRVAETATRSVIAQLAAAEIERAQRKPPSALLARELVWQAVPHLRAADLGSARRALALLERGMRADPDDALSLALAGVGHAQVLNYHGILDEDCGPHCTSSIRLANQAGVLDAADPVVATARAAVATMLFPQNEVAEALAARAVAMDPTSGWTWERRGFSRLLGGDGAERARAELQHAIHLGGPYVSRANCMAGIGRACLATGRIEEANAWTRKAVAENPAASWLYRFVVTAAVMMGDMPAARRSMRLLRDAYPGLRAAHLFPAFAAPLVEAGLPL